MTKLIDLHVHTTSSDGTFSPKEVVWHAKEKGLSAIAITDHDTIDGVEDALSEAEKAGIEIIPGIELTAGTEYEIHILGYFDNKNYKKMNKYLNEAIKYREDRNLSIIHKLNGLGINITFEDVLKFTKNKIITRVHITRAIFEKGYAQDTNEAFSKYLSIKSPGYCPKKNMEVTDAISSILNSNGIPVLAHPFTRIMRDFNLNIFIPELMKLGLMGIETYYSLHSNENTEFLINCAKKNNLLITGGSDFHGDRRPDVQIGIGKGNLKIKYSLLENLKSKLNN